MAYFLWRFRFTSIYKLIFGGSIDSLRIVSMQKDTCKKIWRLWIIMVDYCVFDKGNHMKTGKKKRGLAALLLLAIILVSAAFILPKFFDLNQYSGLIVSALEDATQAEVDIGHITWGLSRGFWLKTDTFSITGPSNFPADLHLTNIHARLAVLPLLSRKIEISELTLDGPAVVLKLEPDESVVSHDKLSKDSGDERLGGVFPFDISVKKMSIQNGRIRIEDGVGLPGQRVVHTFNAVKIDIRDMSPGKEINFHLSLEGEDATELSSLKAQGSFKGLTDTFIITDPEIKLNIRISSLNAEIFNPYIGKRFPGKKLGGHVSLEMDYEGDLLQQYAVEGSADLTGIRYQDPYFGEVILPGGETIISCQAAVDPDDIRVKALKIRRGNNTVNGNALVKNWHEHPVMHDILVSSTLLPEGLLPLLPWSRLDRFADKIRPVLEAGGKVEIEKLTMGPIGLTEPFPSLSDFLSGLGLTANISDISIPPMSGIPELKLVSGNLSLDRGVADIENLQIRVAAVNSTVLFEGLNARVIINPDTINIAEFSTGVLIPETTHTRGGRFSIRVAGHLKNWQKEPVGMIQSLSTSSIPLGPVVSIIPWEQLGDKADPVKKVLLAGGSLKVNSCSLPEINLKKPPKDIKPLISKITADIHFADIEIQPRQGLPKFEGISGNMVLDKGVLNIVDARGRMGLFTFPFIHLQAQGFSDNLAVTANFKGSLKVVETDNVAIKPFLMKKGFKSVTGAAGIDMNFKYVQKQPEEWGAKGSLILDGVNAESHPAGVLLSNLTGKLFFSRAQTTEISVEDLSGKINRASVKLSGKLINGRTPAMVLSGKADIQRLDLAEFNSLLPFLDYLKLVGKLDTDLDFKIPFANPADTKIVGRLETDRLGFHLPDSNIKVKDTDVAMGFGNDRVQLEKMDLNINDQLFHLEGGAAGPAAPKINLRVHASELDVDQLLAGDRQPAKDKKPAEPSPKQTRDIPERSLPSWVDNLTADLQMTLDRGTYRDQPFTDLKFGAHYVKGIFQHYDASFFLANGKVMTTGSADLRNLKKIRVTMNPDIRNVQVGQLSPLFKVEKMPLDGPLFITGHLEGEAGNTQVLLSSLKGSLKADVGAGQIADAKHLGKIGIKILSFVNLKGFFSGALMNKMKNQGIPFTAITSQATFSKGTMNLDKYVFISDALNGSSQGAVDFLDNKIALQVVLDPLQTVDKILGLVPLLGKQAQKLTGVHLLVEGALDDPKVRTALTRGVTDAVKGTLGIPGTFFKDTEELSEEIDANVEEKEDGDNNKNN
jgi:AsmA-like C-terminal region/AsmA family